MVPTTTFDHWIFLLAELMPTRSDSMPEADLRRQEYYRQLGGLSADDFVAACGQILNTDHWFPTIARIREVADGCRSSRLRSRQATQTHSPERGLICPTCHGARWVRLGGYDPVNMLAGELGSRVQPCPNCTTAGRHDREKERFYIAHQGGVPDPNSQSQQDWTPGTNTWRLPRTADGRPDIEALYQESRRLRGLPPGDDRPRAVAGWQTIGQVLAGQDLVAAGVGDDDVSF